MAEAPQEAQAGSCFVCMARKAARGVLCAACSDPLNTDPVERHQIRWRPGVRVDAALVDAFGRCHWLPAICRVGRSDANTVCIPLEHISRRHAELRRTKDHGWECESFGANGTFRNGTRLDKTVALENGDRLSFGHISFYFVRRRVYDSVTRPDPANWSPPSEVRVVFLRPRPAGEGPGSAAVGDHDVSLSERQFNVLEVLLAAAREGKGYVPTEVLRERIPWDEPLAEVSDAAVRKAVQSLRKRLKSTAPGVVQSSRGHGYRLDTEHYAVR
jgi:hypothetical protein